MDASLLWIVAIVAVVVGVAGLVLPVLPGTPLLFGGLWLAAYIDGYAKVSVWVVVLLGVMAAGAWAMDYVAAALGVKRVGASKLAMVGAVLGAIFGLALGLIGLVIGPVLGAMVGEWVARRDAQQATKAGLAAGLGFIVAVAAKLGIAVAMLVTFVFAYFVG
jgi:uncharacterized protein